MVEEDSEELSIDTLLRLASLAEAEEIVEATEELLSSGGGGGPKGS